MWWGLIGSLDILDNVQEIDMIKCANWPVGVCSWSVGGADKAAELMEKLDIGQVHLAVGPALGAEGNKYIDFAGNREWSISATMIDFPQEDYSTLDSIKKTGGIVPDNCWQDNRKRFLDALEVTSVLGVRYISMHAGYLDETGGDYARKFRERVCSLADAAADRGIMLLLETGQESAEHLRDFLGELNHHALGVNFDPANMILYDKGNPIDAVRILASWIKHVHIKDALRTEVPGSWGQEVPWGDGQVDSELFLRTLKEIGFAGTLAIEREAGNQRFEDIKLAAERLVAFEG